MSETLQFACRQACSLQLWLCAVVHPTFMQFVWLDNEHFALPKCMQFAWLNNYYFVPLEFMQLAWLANVHAGVPSIHAVCMNWQCALFPAETHAVSIREIEKYWRWRFWCHKRESLGESLREQCGRQVKFNVEYRSNSTDLFKGLDQPTLSSLINVSSSIFLLLACKFLHYHLPLLH